MTAGDIHFERTMSDTEAMMWHIERDPWLAPSGGAVGLYDRPIDFEEFRRSIAFAVSEVPRLRQRVEESRVPMGPPRWVTDHEFDLDWHVRRIGAPGSGTLRELLDWVTPYLQDPYDRTRPLWQYVVVDGLADGRGAIVSKLHHSVTDGQGAVRMTMAYTSTTRDAPPAPDIDLDAIIAAEPDDGESLAAEARDAVSGVLRLPLDLAKRVIDALGGREGAQRAATEAVDLAKTATEQLQSEGSPLWQQRSRRRHLEGVTWSFGEVRQAAKALGGTINDFFVTTSVEAGRRYHLALGHDPQHFHVTFVVSTVADGDSGQNAFTPVPVELPAGEMALADRFREIHDRLVERRAEVHGGGPLAAVATVASFLPTDVVTSVARGQAARVDFATSNLPGLLGEWYVAGAKMLHTFGFGPVAGTAFNLTLISTNEFLDLGMNLDPAAVTDPVLLRRCFEEAADDLLGLAKPAPAPARKPTARKPTAKKTTTKKTTAKKTTTKTSTARKSPAKQATAAKAPTTTSAAQKP